MNIDKFLKDMIEGNIKSAVVHENNEEIYSKSHEYHNLYHQVNFNYSSAFIVITLKNDEVYFVVPSTCCCPYVEFDIEEIETTSQCDCK